MPYPVGSQESLQRLAIEGHPWAAAMHKYGDQIELPGWMKARQTTLYEAVGALRRRAFSRA
jgi:hypothetical protein